MDDQTGEGSAGNQRTAAVYVEARRPRHAAEVRPADRDPVTFAIAENDARTIGMVRAALETKRLRLAFQPVVQARHPDRVTFHEGLIRVLDPQGRIIPAADFMSAVEQQDLGRLIDCAALEMGLGVLRRHPGQKLSLNMSARSIGFAKFTSTLTRALTAHPGLGARLILEITEGSAMLMPELVTAFMAGMQRFGVAFALDRFGAGATVLRHLCDFDFDILKIDGQFIRGIDTNPDHQQLTEGLAILSRHFGMFTVAESVETAAEAAFLARIGIDCLQGYHIGAPTVRPGFLTGNTKKRA